MPDSTQPDPRRADRAAAERAADHAAIDRLAAELLPALIVKLAATGLGELEVREGAWKVRLRRPAAAHRRASGDRPSAPVARAGGHALARRPSLTPVGPGRDGRDGARRSGRARRRGQPPGRRDVARRRHLPAAPGGPAGDPGPRRRPPRRRRHARGRPGGRGAGRRGRRVEPRRAGRRRRVRPGAGRHRAGAGAGRGRLSRCSARSSSPTAARSRCASCGRAGRSGVEAVVAYSEADRDSLPVQLADEAICIGPADAKRSYLSAPAVISAALVTGCDAIHPGYGFLSEDEGFAEVVAAHGLTFIGPSAAVLERFASKEGTRRLLGEHGLPTIPGSDGMLRDEMHALGEAERIGYPVLIKPSAGGGGKGMRMVRTPRELESALKVCRSEAKAAFGDDSLYLEKWLDENRHVEVQVAVDRYGHGVHLGERDCSVQRRHQKILEEAPTPALAEAARADLAERAVRAVVAAGYENVGHARVPRRPRRATSTSSRSTAGSRSSTR